MALLLERRRLAIQLPSVNGNSIVESTGGSATAEGDRLAIAPEDSVSIGIGKIGANSITSSLLEEERLKYQELTKKHGG